MEEIVSPDQLTHNDPVERFSSVSPQAQDQEFPGLDADLTPRADIGAAAAVAFAR